ncbi:Hypothetical predicted protein [Cloeon dipterum]|uniref:Copper homeostasis protein cutC homolog n=1 Tax=Cloeon dipterum TaxID=197152 RepID=A0A8S1D0U3_9INSE|nr:Hypothetical predicted protein [Cloeon dipterum]
MEVCVESVASAVAAAQGGAARLELCSALSEGGLTPSVGLLKVVKELVSIPVFVMLRPRAGNFTYTPEEVRSIQIDADALMQAGADGVVFGALTTDGAVDEEACSKVISVLPAGTPITFHRAFDWAKEPLVALEDVIKLKFHRILTSGQAATAKEGVDCLQKLINQAEGRIIIMPGCGIDSQNLQFILEKTEEVAAAAPAAPTERQAMIIIITILALIALCISKLRRHPVDKLPGPPTLPFVGNLLTFVGTPEEMFEKFNTFARDFWPLYRTWQLNTPVIHPLLPEHVEKVLASSKNTQKSRDYRFVESWLGTGLFTSNGAKWQERRKLLAPTFHLKVLEQFVPTISDNAAVLAQKLQLLLCQSPNEPIDVVPLVTLCALDIICETAMGRSIRAQHKDSKNTEYVSSIHRIMDLIVYRAMRPWLHPHWIFRVSPTGREFAKCLRTLHRFTRNVIDEKRLEREQGELEIKVVPSVPTSNGYEDLERISVRNRLVFLDLLLKLNEWDCKLSDQEICEEVDTFMFGVRRSRAAN